MARLIAANDDSMRHRAARAARIVEFATKARTRRGSRRVQGARRASRTREGRTKAKDERADAD